MSATATRVDLYYCAVLQQDGNSVSVTFPDVPEVITFGRDEADALYQAADALGLALLSYLWDRRPLPEKTADSEHPVMPLIDYALQIQVLERFRMTGTTPQELASRMGVKPRKIEALLQDGRFPSVRFLERALHAMGSRTCLGIDTNSVDLDA